MLTNYNVISKRGKIIKYRDEPCFSAIHRNISNYNKVRVFILDNYEYCNKYDGYYMGYNEFSFKEKKEYCSLLRKMGLHVSDPRRSLVSELDYGDDAYQKCQYIDVYTGDMPEPAGLLSIYAIRYLYEDTFPSIVKKFLEWKYENHVSLIHRFLLAHWSIEHKTYNHTFINYRKVIGLPTEEEYKSILFSQNTTTSLYNMFNHFDTIPDNYRALIKAVNSSLEKAIEVYNRITIGVKGEKFDDGF